jgi:hypothetical protein
VTLPAEIFDVPVNVPLIPQVVVAQLATARQVTHSTKTRGEVRGGGAKPYQQKVFALGVGAGTVLSERVWHVAQGLRKGLEKASEVPRCEACVASAPTPMRCPRPIYRAPICGLPSHGQRA